MISNFEEDDKIYFINKETATTSTSGILTAIILLVFGISLVVAFFTYLVMSTKYMSKRIKWIREFNMKQKNVDVDPTLEADYLINGMYL
jgi:Na+-transporting methylmalonyl-CoA/oxaloacetate decarboxylase gamma subunit